MTGSEKEKHGVPLGDCRHLRVGNVVTRWLAGTVPMRMTITAVDSDLIYVGDPSGGWRFSRTTGAEHDPELGWGDHFGVTGSYLGEDA
jgi:hypothetical protein